MTSIRTQQRDDAELGLLSHQDDSDEEFRGSADDHSTSNQRLWPKDLIGRNLGAKMGTVASEKVSIRLGFLRKVFGIVSFQIVLTTAICAALYMSPSLSGFIHSQSWILLPILFGSLGLLVALHLNAHTVPLNYILLAAFTTLQAITVGCIVTMYKLQVVLEAALLTSVVCVALFLYTLQTKRDFVKSYALGFSLVSVLLVASIFQVLFMSPAFNFIVNVAGAMIFCFLLIIDLDVIMNYLSPEDYILACITLYMDIINLFIRILQLLGEAQRN